jgi:hypothetical protein
LLNANDTEVQNICAIENEGGIRGNGDRVKITGTKFLGIQIDEAIAITGNDAAIHNNKLIHTDGINISGQNAEIFGNVVVVTTDNPCIKVTGANALIIANKALECAEQGINLAAGTDGKIVKNVVEGVVEGSEGILAVGSRIEIGENETRETSNSGISFTGSNGRVHNNHVKIGGAENVQPGILINGSNNIIFENVTDVNSNAGILNAAGSRNQYLSNLSIGNGKSGIRLNNGDRNILRLNQTLKNQGEGINNGPTATNSTIENNTSLGNRTDVCNDGTIAVFVNNFFATGGVNTPCVVEKI